jgi:hypothetical protein
MRHLLREESLPQSAKKILGFTDNRQDASLQAGHLNDFVMILLLRGALLAALWNQPDGVLTDDTLTHRILEHLRLSPADFASSPDAKGAKAEGAKRALRDVLGYRTYFDLRRGWRFTHPNLEQLGLSGHHLCVPRRVCRRSGRMVEVPPASGGRAARPAQQPSARPA